MESMPYIIGWAIDYVVLTLTMRNTKRWAWAMWLLFYLAVISIIRDSGTDTEFYEQVTRSLLVNGSLPLTGWEPGFSVLLRTISLLVPSDVLAVRMLALLFMILIGIFLLRSDRNERFFLLSFFIPAFFYAYSMNAVRAGLAIAVFLLASQELRRGRLLRFWFMSTVAISFHYSVAVPVIIYHLLDLNIRHPRRFVLLFVILIVMLLALLCVNDGYFLRKLLMYSEMKAPSPTSGLSRTIGIIILITGTLLSRLPGGMKGKIVLVFLGLALFCQYLVSLSYAGLRLLDLVFLLCPLAVLRSYDRSKMRPGRPFTVALIVSGVIAAVATYHNFLTDYNGRVTGSSTPFLPYRTILDGR